MPDYIYTHYPDNPAKVSIASFGNFTFPFKFSRLVDTWIKSCIGNKLLIRRKAANIFYLSKEMKGSSFSYTINGKKNFKVLTGGGFFTNFSEKGFNFFKAFFEKKEFFDSSFKDVFFNRPVLRNRFFCKIFEVFNRNGEFSSFLRRKDRGKLIFRGIENSLSRGEFFKDLENGFVVNIRELFQSLRKSYHEKFFDVIFLFSDFLSDSFSFPCEIFKFFRNKGILREFMMEVFEKDSNNFSIKRVCFGFSEVEFREVVDKKGIDNDTGVVIEAEKGDKVKVVAATYFNAKEKGAFRGFREVFEEGFKTVKVKRIGFGKKDIFRGINEACGKGVFRGIKTDKVGVVHDDTSLSGILVRQGRACNPILQHDEGLFAQPTYYGLSRQATHSFEGFLAQVKWSCPALPLYSFESYLNCARKLNKVPCLNYN